MSENDVNVWLLFGFLRGQVLLGKIFQLPLQHQQTVAQLVDRIINDNNLDVVS